VVVGARKHLAVAGAGGDCHLVESLRLRVVGGMHGGLARGVDGEGLQLFLLW